MNSLIEDYYYSIINENEFFEIFKENRKSVFDEAVYINMSPLLSDLERDKLSNLGKNLVGNFKLFIKITKAEKVVGWSFGRQTDDETFTMMNSGILKEHRNKGLYTKLLKKLLDILEEEGFQKVESQHHTSNNQVIIPKLKAGFTITGLEVEDKVGMKVRLNYYFNSKRKEILDFRIGNKKLNKDFEQYMDLWK